MPEVELVEVALVEPPKIVVNPVVREAFEVIPRFDFPINDTNIAFNTYRYSNGD